MRTKAMATRLRQALSRDVAGLDVSSEVLRLRISSDPYLSEHYSATYRAMIAQVVWPGKGPIVEVGAGSGVVDLVDARVIRSDLQPGRHVDICLNAQHLPFRTRSVGALLLKDALHHIPDVEMFLHEAARVLVPGGSVVVMDPYWGLLAKAIYRWFHPEPFDSTTPTWSFEASGPWSSNQALLYLLLRRDRTRFDERFRAFTIREIGPCIGPSFLLSGGLYGRTPLPSTWLMRLRRWEARQGRWLNPLRFGYLAVLEKRTDDC